MLSCRAGALLAGGLFRPAPVEAASGGRGPSGGGVKKAAAQRCGC